MTRKEERTLLGFLAIGAGLLAIAEEAPTTGACLILGGAAIIDPPTAEKAVASICAQLSKRPPTDTPTPPPRPTPIFVISRSTY